MLRVASVGSGSKGNGTLVASEETTLLIDCGFPAREVLSRLKHLNVEISDIDAILVTHEHSDHVCGVAAVSKAASAPIYATHGTLASGKLEGAQTIIEIESDSNFAIGDIEVSAVTVPHDAREPVQYIFKRAAQRVGVLTDLGMVSPHVLRAYEGCDLLLLEFNHDLAMLRRGPYPASLKRRVSGDLGHLNNKQALGMLQAMGEALPGTVIAGHVLSKIIRSTSSFVLRPLIQLTEINVIYATQVRI